jgi:hypothetical protein
MRARMSARYVRVQAGELRRLDQSHSIGEGLAAGIGTGEEPVLPFMSTST